MKQRIRCCRELLRWWLAENIKSNTSFYGLELKLETNLDFKGKSQMF